MRRPARSTLFPYTTLFRSLNTSVSSVAPLLRTTGTCLMWLHFVHVASNRSCHGPPSSCTALRARLSGDVDKIEPRSEEHTSELQSRRDLVCRLLLEKKKTK